MKKNLFPLFLVSRCSCSLLALSLLSAYGEAAVIKMVNRLACYSYTSARKEGKRRPDVTE